MTTEAEATTLPAPQYTRLALLSALAGLVMVLCLAVFLYTRIAYPGDGAPIVFDLVGVRPDGFVVHPLVLKLGGLKQGDVVNGVQGHSVDELVVADFSRRAPPVAPGAESYIYTVTREGMARGVRVPLGPYPLAQALSEDWTLYLFLVYMAGLSTFVFTRRPDLPTARVFFRMALAALTSQFIFTMNYQVSDFFYGWLVPFLVAANLVLWFYALSGGLHFALNFPRLLPVLKNHAVLWFWIYAGPWVIYAVVMLLLAREATSPVALLQLHYRATVPVGGVYFVLIFTGFVLSYRSASSSGERRQLRWVLWGTAIAFFPWVILLILSPLLGVSPRTGLPILGVSFMALPTALAVAILREKLFDIDLIINRTLVYVPLTAILAGLYSALVGLSQRTIMQVTGQSTDAAGAIAALVVVTVFTPLKDAIQHAVDRRFKGQQEAKDRFLAFGEHVRLRLVAVAPAQLARRFLEEAALAFGAEGGAVFLEKDSQLEQINTIGAWQDNVEISVPLEIGHPPGRLGLVQLGRREHERDYTPADIRVLEQVAGIVAQAIYVDGPQFENA